MSRNRFRPDAGSVPASKLARGPNGRALCRYCSVEVPRGRRTFCSAGCVHEWQLRTNAEYVRHHVFVRDQGVCALCGVDTVAIVRDLEAAARPPHRPGTLSREQHADWLAEYQRVDERLKQRLAELRIPWARWEGRRSQGIWDADHIVPVVEGGGECGLDNYRTLCLPCHRDETARLRRRLAGKLDSHELF